MNCIWRAFFWLVFAASAAPAWAQQAFDETQVLLGFEPTATSKEIRAKKFNDDRLLDRMLARMPGATKVGSFVDWNGNKYRFHTDPGVVEFSAPPMRVGEISKLLTPLYQAFADVGLSTVYPRDYPGPGRGTGSHIHVEQALFKDRPLLLRNIYVEIHNRPYLGAIFNDPFDHVNARPIFETGQQSYFLKRLAALDAHAAASGGYEFQKVYKALLAINERVDSSWPAKYVEVGMQAHGNPTIEFRLFCGQKGVADIELQARLLLAMLKRANASNVPIKARRFSREQWETLRGPRRAQAEFERYVRELGLDWNAYRRFAAERVGGVLRKMALVDGVRHELEIRLYDMERFKHNPSAGIDRRRYAYEVVVTQEVSRVVVNGRELILSEIPGENGLRSGIFMDHERNTFLLEAYDRQGRAIEAFRMGSPRTHPPRKPVEPQSDAGTRYSQEKFFAEELATAMNRLEAGGRAEAAPAAVARPANYVEALLGRAAETGAAQPRRGEGALASARSAAVQGLQGQAAFVTGYGVKGLAEAAWHRDPELAKRTAADMLRPEFAGMMGVFYGTQLGTDRMLKKMNVGGGRAMAARVVLPAYSSMAVMDAATGRRDVRAVLVEGTAMTGVGLAMTQVTGFLKPVLMAAGSRGQLLRFGLESALAGATLAGYERATPYVERAFDAVTGAGSDDRHPPESAPRRR